jgi:uncharacterized membrane protein
METDLKYHIKRTDLLEEQVECINKKAETLNVFGLILSNAIKILPIITGVILTVITIMKLLKK